MIIFVAIIAFGWVIGWSIAIFWTLILAVWFNISSRRDRKKRSKMYV